MDTFVIYWCGCGNYVAEPTVENAEAAQTGRFRLGGAVYCSASTHGAVQPEMRREIVKKEST